MGIGALRRRREEREERGENRPAAVSGIDHERALGVLRSSLELAEKRASAAEIRVVQLQAELEALKESATEPKKASGKR